jgi:hypothetical protein
MIVLLQDVLGVAFNHLFELVNAEIVGRAHLFQLSVKLLNLCVLLLSHVLELEADSGNLFVHRAVQFTDLVLVAFLFLGRKFRELLLFLNVASLLFVDRPLHLS